MTRCFSWGRAKTAWPGPAITSLRSPSTSNSKRTRPSSTTQVSIASDSSWVWKVSSPLPPVASGSRRIKRARTWGTASMVPEGSSRQSKLCAGMG